MPKFRGLPRRKKPDYLGPKQQRYNTPHAVGDWITRPSRGNRKWSFFLRGKREQGLRFQIDLPEEVRKYRSFRRMWCRSLNLDPISFVPVSGNGQARGWRFLSPGSDTGYWEVIARPGDDQESEWCEYVPGQPQRHCFAYIDDAGVAQEICTEEPGRIRYEYENDPSDIPGNQCEYGTQCRKIGRVTYLSDASGLLQPGNIIDIPGLDLDRVVGNNIVDFDLGPCDGPNSTLTVRKEQEEVGGTLTYTDNDTNTTVTIPSVSTWSSDLVGTTTKLVRWLAEITQQRRAPCGTFVQLTRGQATTVVDGLTWDVVDKNFGTGYAYGPANALGMQLITVNNGINVLGSGSGGGIATQRSCWYYPSGPGGSAYWTVQTTGVQVRADVGGSYNVTVNGSPYASYTNEPTDFDFTPGGGSGEGTGEWTIYVDRDGTQVFSDGPFKRNPGGSWFPIKKDVPYYDCEEQPPGDPPPPCTLVVYGGVTDSNPTGVEIGRVTREDGTCPVAPPLNSGNGNGGGSGRLPTPGIRCTPVSYPGDPYYETIWREGEYTEATSEYRYSCTCPYYSGQVTSLSDSLDSNRNFNSNAPYFRYQQRTCKHIMAAMRANGDLSDADIPYDETTESQFYENLNTARYLEANPFIIPLQVCSPEYVDELMEELEETSTNPLVRDAGTDWHNWDQSQSFGKWGENWDSAGKF